MNPRTLVRLLPLPRTNASRPGHFCPHSETKLPCVVRLDREGGIGDAPKGSTGRKPHPSNNWLCPEWSALMDLDSFLGDYSACSSVIYSAWAFGELIWRMILTDARHRVIFRAIRLRGSPGTIQSGVSWQAQRP